jgi:uncharacterized protein (TIGR02246 family)
MRSALLAASVLLCALVSSAFSAQSAAPQPSSWKANEQQIRAATAASADAWNRGDLKGHLALYAEDVTFMTRSGPRPGVAPIEESFSKKYFQDGKPKQHLSFEDVAVRPLGRDAALETGRYVLTGGGEPDQTGWFTLVWLRTAGGWKVVHDHSS